MLFNKVSGGAEKVKINGQKVDKNLDLETDFAIKDLAFSGGANIIPKCVMYHPLFKKYLVLDAYKERAFLLSRSGFKEGPNRWMGISTPPSFSKFIFFKDNEVILIGSQNEFYKVDIKEDGKALYTAIGGSFSEPFIRFWYNEETKELFGESSSGTLKKFNFNSKTWTEIATYEGILSCVGVIRNRKIIWLGLPKNEKRKSVVEFNGKTFTEKIDVLNVEIELSTLTRAGILNGKIHVFSKVKINDIKKPEIHVVEKNEYKFERLRDITGMTIDTNYGNNNCSYNNNNKLALLCFGNDRGSNIEVVEVYKEREV